MTRVGASFFFYPYTAVTHSAPFDIFTSCADTPDVAAITSGSVTSFDTKTESDDAAAHVASEKVEFWTKNWRLLQQKISSLVLLQKREKLREQQQVVQAVFRFEFLCISLNKEPKQL